jgi:hypothetical protein
VVAGGDRVEPHLVHELGDDLALVVAVEQRALEFVAGRQQDDVLAGALELAPALVDGGLQAGDAAKTLASRLAFGVTGRIGTGDGFETRMEIVDMQDIESELGLYRRCEAGGQCQRRGA